MLTLSSGLARLDAAAERGSSVLEDLSIVGFDDIAAAEHPGPPPCATRCGS